MQRTTKDLFFAGPANPLTLKIILFPARFVRQHRRDHENGNYLFDCPNLRARHTIASKSFLNFSYRGTLSLSNISSFTTSTDKISKFCYVFLRSFRPSLSTRTGETSPFFSSLGLRTPPKCTNLRLRPHQHSNTHIKARKQIKALNPLFVTCTPDFSTTGILSCFLSQTRTRQFPRTSNHSVSPHASPSPSLSLTNPTFFILRPTPQRMEHHSHSPGVMELNVEQLEHLHDVALSGRSYGEWHFSQ